MYVRIGFLGHALTVHFGPEEVVGGEPRSGFAGGSGGLFERFEEPSEFWEESEEEAGFGFCRR